MGNQQAKVSEREIGWLCGMVDGEGSLMIVQNQSCKNNTRWVPRITIVGTHTQTLNYLSNLLDNIELPYHISWRLHNISRASKKASLHSWDLRVQGFKRVIRWLNTITPYLITKQRQAEFLLDFCNSRINQNHLDEYTPEQVKLIQTIRGMNHSLASTTTR